MNEHFIEESVSNMLRTEVSTTYANMDSRMEHAIMGIADESGELTSIMLKARFYNKPIDIPHYKDELGDLWWYLCLAVDDLAKSEGKNPIEVFRELLKINKAKLAIRYPEKYSNDQALCRDLRQEKSAVHDAAGSTSKTEGEK